MGNKHSRLGIASFIMAVISIAGIILAIFLLVSAIGSQLDPAAIQAGELPTLPEGLMKSVITATGLFFLFIILSLIGAVLGVAGLFQKDRLKLFAILGLVFNGLLVFLIVAIVFISALAGPTLPGTF